MITLPSLFSGLFINTVYSGKFLRGSIFTDGRSLPFCGFNFRGYTHSRPLYTVQLNFFQNMRNLDPSKFSRYTVCTCTRTTYNIHVGQRLRVRSRSGSHSEPGTGISLAAKKREWTETSEASQEDERETGGEGEGEGEGLHPEAKRLVQGAQPTGHHMK